MKTTAVYDLQSHKCQEFTMSKLMFPIVALLAFIFVNASAENANARGIHFNTGRVHVDVGRPHAYYGGYGRYYGNRTHSAHRYYPSTRRAHVWHDTSHLDWHPAEVRLHHGHVDVSPGHYDWHQEGHVDHLHR
jgi:hypothetical protein